MSLLKKFTIGVVLALVVGVVAPGVAGAATAAELQAQIEALQAQLSALMAQLSDIDGGSGSGSAGGSCVFSRNLYPGMSGEDVKCLQQYMNSAGHQVAASGAGSPGNETLYFGSLTRAAVKSWQDANGVSYGAYWGYFGPASQAVYNSLGPVSPADPADPDVPVVVGDGELMISLANDTPVGATIADNANDNFTKVTFTAGDADVEVSKIYVKRIGNTGNSDVENVKFIDMDGVKHGSVGSFNVDSRAMITFTPVLEIEAGESASYYIRAGFADGTTGGRTAALGIYSVDDVTSDADVSGSFPVMGNYMSVVDMTIGTATIAEDGTTVDSQPDVGDTDVVINQFKITAGSTEGITVEQITAEETGTASLDDIANIELYSVTNGESLGTVSGWNSEGRASWADLNISIAKGKVHRFEMRADIVDGPSLTVNSDVKDGSDWLIDVKGNTYGYYITPTGSWGGAGNSAQTIQSGALSVSKSAATPATGNIAEADEQALAAWDFVVSGEDVKISALTLDMDFGVSGTALIYSEVTNVALYDANDNIVAGPVDCADATGCDVAFTDTFIVPVGTSVYTAKATISSDAISGDDVDVGFTPGDVTAKGMTSNDTIVPTPATEVEGNLMTVAAGALNATTLSQPAARDIAKGADDHLWMIGSLDASNSGEDVRVTAITIADDVTGTGGFDDIDSAELWADLTDENSARGDIFETKISDTKFPTATGDGTQAFSLSQTITVAKSTYTRFAFIGDLATGATTNDQHVIDISAVTATGASTGGTVSVSPSGTGQAMTVKASGDAVLTLDASSPNAGLVLDESVATLAVFRITANSIEDLDLDSMKITDDGTGDDGVDTYYFYHGDELIQQAPGGATAEVFFTDGTVTIPANDYVLITVKGLMADVDGTAVVNGDDIRVTIEADGDVDTTGLASGAAVDPDDTDVDAAIQEIYESYPVFALNPASPVSGTLDGSAAKLVAVYDVTANGSKDVTFHNADTVLLSIQTTVGGGDDDAGTENVWIVDENGNTLDTVTMTSAEGTNQEDFDFDGNDWTIAAGETETLYVYADVSDLEADGDTFQVWFDNAAADCTFGVNGGTGIAEGDNIFRLNQGLYGGVFVNPS